MGHTTKSLFHLSTYNILTQSATGETTRRGQIHITNSSPGSMRAKNGKHLSKLTALVCHDINTLTDKDGNPTSLTLLTSVLIPCVASNTWGIKFSNQPSLLEADNIRSISFQNQKQLKRRNTSTVD